MQFKVKSESFKTPKCIYLKIGKPTDWSVTCEKKESRIEGKQMVKIVYLGQPQRRDQMKNSTVYQQKLNKYTLYTTLPSD